MMTIKRNIRKNTGIFHINKLIVLILFLNWIVTCTSASLILSKQNNTVQVNITSINHNGTSKNALFHWEDYSVLVTMLVVSCAIGIYYGYFGAKQTTSDDFLLGGSAMGTFPMALSLAASYVTAIELLGNPAEMYVAGAQFWMICISFILVVPITSHLYLPVFMRLRLTSCYEYLEVRFCKSVRIYASTLYMIQMILYTAVAVYAPALALSDVTGLNTYLAVTLVYVVCIFYATQGGMKAVIMTDSFQSAVLIGSMAAVLALGASHVGGLENAWDYAQQTDRLHFFNMNPDPTVRHSFWSVIVGGTMYWTSMFCANQASIQKYLSVERISQARMALWVSAISLVLIYSVNFVTGAVLAAYYADCDPIQAGEINASDRLLPLFVVQQLGKARGVPGFFVAGIFAASLGTVASGLNSLAAIACQDLATGLLGITLPENKGANIARWVCLGCGALSFVLVFIVERLGPVLQLALSFNGMTGGVSLGLFTLGMIFPWATAKGAVIGGIFGLLLVVVAGGGAQLSQVTLQRLPGSISGCHASYNLTGDTVHATLIPTTYPLCIHVVIGTEKDIEYLSYLYSQKICSYASEAAAKWIRENHDGAVFWLFRVSYLWYSGIGCVATLLVGLLTSILTGVNNPAEVPIDLISPPVVKFLNFLPHRVKKVLHIPMGMGYERRRSSSVRPPSVADDKDTRRRRRLSEMAGGVFYSDSNTISQGHDNLALVDAEKPHPNDCDQNTSF